MNDITNASDYYGTDLDRGMILYVEGNAYTIVDLWPHVELHPQAATPSERYRQDVVRTTVLAETIRDGHTVRMAFVIENQDVFKAEC